MTCGDKQSYLGQPWAMGLLLCAACASQRGAAVLCFQLGCGMLVLLTPPFPIVMTRHIPPFEVFFADCYMIRSMTQNAASTTSE